MDFCSNPEKYSAIVAVFMYPALEYWFGKTARVPEGSVPEFLINRMKGLFFAIFMGIFAVIFVIVLKIKEIKNDRNKTS